MNPDPAIVEAKLGSMREALRELGSVRGMTLEEYTSDALRRAGVERYMCRLVEIAADINGHIVARVLRRAPATMGDSFLMAVEAGVLDERSARSLLPSVGMRNRLVHEYDRIDNAIVHGAIAKALEAYGAYLEQVLAYLDRTP